MGVEEGPKRKAPSMWKSTKPGGFRRSEHFFAKIKEGYKPLWVADGRPGKIQMTMIPLSFISESVGAEVGWDGDTNTVTLTYK